MGSESTAYEVEGQIGRWLRGHEGERNNYCFSKIQLVGQKNIEKNLSCWLNLDFHPFLPAKHYKYTVLRALFDT